MDTNKPTARDVLAWIEAALKELHEIEEADDLEALKEWGDLYHALTLAVLLDEARDVLADVVAGEVA